MCSAVDQIVVHDQHGRARAVQSCALDRWSDGSLRWALLDLLADVETTETRWRVGVDPSTDTPTDTPTLTVSERDTGITVSTGVTTFVIARSGFPLQQVISGGVARLDARTTGLRAVGADGCEWRFDSHHVEIHARGPIRAVLFVQGRLMDQTTARADCDVRLHFFAGSPTIRLDVILRNPRRAQHPDGYWDLGDAGSLHLREMTITLGTAEDGVVSLSPETGRALDLVPLPLSLVQQSSGGPAWQSPVHLTAERQIPQPTRGYTVAAGHETFEGLRATPVVEHRSADAMLRVALPQCWQNFPKAVHGDARALRVSFFPETNGAAHEVQGGEQKTHTVFVSFGEDGVSEQPLEWCRTPTRPRTTADAYAAAGAIPSPTLRPHALAPDYARLLAPAFEGDQSFFAKRERVDEYGWRHFGDLYADHEAVRHTGDAPFVSHYNNQYDAISGFAAHFMRTGDWRAWDLMDDLARHVIDIDVYHTTEDRAAYSQGHFWHTNHYTPADTATHRSYARASKLPGGGPSNEHNYTTGLMLHYFLTGSVASAETVLMLAEWVLAMDDGSRSRFRWIDRGPTGLASCTYTPDYQGPGRGAANSINALLDAHRLSGEARFLTAAEALIRRVIHPDDDPAMHGLLDPERRWSYTVFLQMLARYLDYAGERGSSGEMAAYARASLLKYARWMAAHERPYLDRPEQLEFPTETWAAQDLRKADVFDAARRYGRADERATFTERRDFFFGYSLRTLASMPTSTCTRPLVLLLVAGGRVAFAPDDEARAGSPDAPQSFAARVPFVPQKARVKRRIVLLAIGVAVLLLVALWWIL